MPCIGVVNAALPGQREQVAVMLQRAQPIMEPPRWQRPLAQRDRALFAAHLALRTIKNDFEIIAADCQFDLAED